MKGNDCRVIFVLAAFAIAASGCAHTISSEMRQRAAKDLSFPVVQQNPTAHVGEVVIWGGVIIRTVNHTGGTILKVLETPLDSQEMPKDEDQSRGRFLARVPKYLDPEVFRRGRKVTLAGEIVGEKEEPIGEIEYRYPVLRVKELHLWKEVPRRYLAPFPYAWGWYWGPYFWPHYHLHFYHGW